VQNLLPNIRENKTTTFMGILRISLHRHGHYGTSHSVQSPITEPLARSDLSQQIDLFSARYVSAFTRSLSRSATYWGSAPNTQARVRDMRSREMDSPPGHLDS
jgi:hypothetical protein